MRRTFVQMLDVFLNITGGIHWAQRCDGVGREANVNQHVAILRPRRNALDPYYLSLVLNTNQLQRAIDKAQIGASRQGLNFAQIKALQIPICQIERQRELACCFKESIATRTRIRDLAKDARLRMKEEN